MINRQKLIEDIEKEFDGVCVYDVSGSQAASDFIEIVYRQPSADQWIPCSERLPEDINNVLITTVGGHVQIGWYDYRYEIWYSHITNFIQKVTSWMPLPEPYKGVK